MKNGWNKTGYGLSRCLLSAVSIIFLAGSASAGQVGGATSDINITARITTCQPAITVTDYTVTVKPSDGRSEGAESSGSTYFPAAVATIDNSKCDYDLDVTGSSDGQASNPGLHLSKIGASLSINSEEGKAGGWKKAEGSSVATLTVLGKTTQTLYAGINPWKANTVYTTGSEEGVITLTLSPH